MNFRRLAADLLQTVIPLVLGILVIRTGQWLALATGLPALSVAGTLSGIALAGIGPARIIRRIVFPRLDLKALMLKAIADDPGRAWVGVCIVIGAILLALSGGARGADLPDNAQRHLPILQAEQRAHWPAMPLPSALAGQVEQETCPSLKSPKCWSTRAELRTDREQGVGMPQITRAFRADGSIRFDSLAELRAQFKAELGGWAWDSPTLYDPAYQLRALVLMDRRNWQAIQGTATEDDRLRMTLTSYNGGLRGLASDRALCAGTAGCDPSRWVGHVERTCTKSQTAAPGYGKSFCAINREYSHLILDVRRAKYVARMDGG